jgi:hypothetical protein
MSEKNTIYRGKATIMNIGAEELTEKMLEKLPEGDRETALMLVFDVQTAEPDPRRFDVKLEVSHRELTGKALEWNKREDGRTPTQIDVTLKDLVKQGLLAQGATEADLGAAMAEGNLGREVTISVTEDAKGDGTFWPPRARFVSPFARLQGAAAADRLAAFISGKPAPKVQASAPATAPGGVPAPEEGDPDDMPF